MALRSVIFLMTTMVVKRGDIFYADLSPVIGSEQGGIRPVIIIQNDIGNRYSPTVIVAAITSQINKAKYVSGQMSFRNSRFNFIRALAFTQKEYSSVQTSPKRVLKHFINPKSHLFTQPKHTNKSSYDKQSKQRDIIISSKLKGYYSQNDIERLLNGRQPLQTE